jgi:hypothetical protein
MPDRVSADIVFHSLCKPNLSVLHCSHYTASAVKVLNDITGLRLNGVFVEAARSQCQASPNLDSVVGDFYFLPIKCFEFANNEILQFPTSALRFKRSGVLH